MLGIGLSLTRAGVPQAFAELNLLSPTLDPRITFTGGPVTYIGSDGLLHTSATNECPLEYDPVTLQPVGRSFWEARTNLQTYSELMTDASWSAVDTTITSNATIAPDGNNTGNLYTEGSAASAKVTKGTTVPSLTLSASRYFKRGNSDWVRFIIFDSTGSNGAVCWVNLATKQLGTVSNAGTGTGTTASLTNHPNGWVRVKMTTVLSAGTFASVITTSAVADNSATRLANATRYEWGAQLEAAATAGPYIPTTTAQVTRAADVATVNDLSTLRFNPAQGTLYVDYTPLIVDGTTNASVVSVNDGTTSNRWQVRTQTANVFGTLVSGGTDASRAVSGSYAAGQNIKAAIAFSSTGDSLYVNGVANTSAKTIGPLNTNILTIGYGPGDTRGSTVTPVRIRRVRYYPTRLTDAQLQAITT